jgi:signal transduction histidine kinase
MASLNNIWIIVDPQDLFESLASRVRSVLPKASISHPDSFTGFLDLMQSQRPDVVVTENHVSWSSGFDIYQKVKNEYPGCFFLMYTANGNEQLATESIKRGFYEYLSETSSGLDRLAPCLRLLDSEMELASPGGELPPAAQHSNSAQLRIIEEEMRKTMQKEKELNRLRIQFVSMTSHEFRTPLSTILTSAELLEHYGHRWPVEKHIYHLKRIQSSVQQIIRLMDDLLILGRADTGRLATFLEPTDVTALTQKLIDDAMSTRPGSHQIDMHLQCGTPNLLLDRKLYSQIFLNIFSNALKYSPVGSSVKISLSCNETTLSLTVSDQGIGIPEPDQARLFQPFFRAGNVSDQPGTGLGLSIVKRSVEAHNGSVAVDSIPGKGTTIQVVLDIRE